MNKFSFEVPLHNLEDFTIDQDYIFSLSFLYSHKEYKKHIRDCQDLGLEIWLDNSYNELKIATSPSELSILYQDFSPDFVICPDDDTWTITQYLQIYQKMQEHIPAERLYLVARNPQHFEAFIEAKIDQNIAIPYEFRPEYTGRIPEGAEGFSPYDKTLLEDSHFLGLNTYDEPLNYSPRSCDTSMPIKLALLGITISTWIKNGEPHIDSTPDFFLKKLTKQQIKLSKENIQFLKTTNQLT